MSTQHVTAYYVDALDGRPASEAPLRHGPVPPSDTLEIDAVDRRQEPPLIIGRLPEGEALSPGMVPISEQAHAAMLADYHAWRDEAAARELHKMREGMVLSQFQARAVLRQRGYRDQVEAIMADPETDPLIVDAWHYAREFRRLSPTILGLMPILGVSDAEADEMFEEGKEIEA